MCREMEQMREEARKEGQEEGENRFAKLVRLLMDAKDYETLQLVTADSKLRGEYYERYGI